MDKKTVFAQFFRSISVHLPKAGSDCYYFRSIPVQGVCVFSYICTGKSTKFSTSMAGTIKDMSQIKQVLQLKQLGESNRGIARKLPIDKETINAYTKTRNTFCMLSACALNIYEEYRRFLHRTI